MQDAWGYPIQYEIRGDNEAALISYGRDGKPGGTKDDADIVRTFALFVSATQKVWADELDEWKNKPRRTTSRVVIEGPHIPSSRDAS
ncbi:MAG: type II secretion system protein GspG [Tepidisphaeraceae bacterium]